MSYLLENIPYFECLVRREYTRDMAGPKGQYLKAIAFAVWCRRGRMLGFQVMFTGKDQDGNEANSGGAMFSQIPIEALVWKPCEMPPARHVAPWDVFSETFTVVTLELIHRSRAFVLPERLPGRYLFTVDYTRSDLADNPEQHKQHHVLMMGGGWFAVMPNNRLLVSDPAFWDVTEERPDFTALTRVFSAE
jgi:hypothetical protein